MRTKKRISRMVLYALSILLSLIFLAPLLWMVTSSFKTEGRIFADLTSLKAFWPTEWIFDNYATMQSRIDIVGNMLNSLLYVSVMVLLGLIVNSLCGFALAKFRFKYRDKMLGGIIALMIIPFESIVLPLYFVAYKFHLLYTYTVLIIPFVGNCFSIFLFRQFFLGIPDELLEAGYIDGASPVKAFFHIVAPSSLPVYATVLILQFIEHWSDFMWPVLVSDEHTKTIQLGVQTLFSSQPVQYGTVMAGLTLATLPVVVMFAFFQKYYIQGISTSGIKG
ncbi:MAG: carbohydrate ABC transporter permease [Clostridia bacterium]